MHFDRWFQLALSLYFFSRHKDYFFLIIFFLTLLSVLMFRLIKHHHFNSIRTITSKAIERPHAHAFYDDKITTVIYTHTHTFFLVNLFP